MEIAVRTLADDDRDHLPVFELLHRRGLASPTKEDFDLVRRAHTVARAVFLAEDEAGNACAVMALFDRSPDVLWGANFATGLAKETSVAAAFEIWSKTLEFACDNGYSVVTTKPRPSQSRVRDFFRLMGLLSITEDEMETPLPVCERLWARLGDRGRLPPRLETKEGGKVVRFYGRRTLIEVDRQVGKVICRGVEEPSEVAARASYIPVWPQQIRTGTDVSADLACCKNLSILAEIGRVIFANGHVAILPPWWTRVGTWGLELPAFDHWPSMAARTSDGIELMPINSQFNNIVHIQHRDRNSHVLAFNCSDGGSFLRLSFEASVQARLVSERLVFPEIDLTVMLGSTVDRVEQQQWNDHWRTHLYFSAKLVNCTVYSAQSQDQGMRTEHEMLKER